MKQENKTLFSNLLELQRKQDFMGVIGRKDNEMMGSMEITGRNYEKAID